MKIIGDSLFGWKFRKSYDPYKNLTIPKGGIRNHRIKQSVMVNLTYLIRYMKRLEDPDLRKERIKELEYIIKNRQGKLEALGVVPPKNLKEVNKLVKDLHGG